MNRMNELSLDERDLIDKVNKINKRLVGNADGSLWNVAKAYLNNRIPRDILNRSKNEIIDILKEINNDRENKSHFYK